MKPPQLPAYAAAQLAVALRGETPADRAAVAAVYLLWQDAVAQAVRRRRLPPQDAAYAAFQRNLETLRRLLGESVRHGPRTLPAAAAVYRQLLDDDGGDAWCQAHVQESPDQWPELECGCAPPDRAVTGHADPGSWLCRCPSLPDDRDIRVRFTSWCPLTGKVAATVESRAARAVPGYSLARFAADAEIADICEDTEEIADLLSHCRLLASPALAQVARHWREIPRDCEETEMDVVARILETVQARCAVADQGREDVVAAVCAELRCDPAPATAADELRNLAARAAFLSDRGSPTTAPRGVVAQIVRHARELQQTGQAAAAVKIAAAACAAAAGEYPAAVCYQLEDALREMRRSARRPGDADETAS